MRKATILALSVFAMFVLASGCGPADYSPDFVGTYFGDYTATFTSGSTGQTASAVYQTAFQISAGSAVSDLVLGGPCGMTGHASNPTSFITFQATCLIYDSTSGCNITYDLHAGAGTKNGPALTMVIPGTETFICPASADSGTLTLNWTMTEQ